MSPHYVGKVTDYRAFAIPEVTVDFALGPG